MFVKNNQISSRQVFRLLTYDFLGFGALMIPTVLAKVAGRDGIFCIAIGLLGGYFFVKLLKEVLKEMQGDYVSYVKKSFGSIAGGFVEAGYIVYFLLLAGNISYLLSNLVLTNLLKEESFYLVLALILVLAYYGVSGGIEGRARVYEILFYFLLIPLAAMLVFSVREINPDYWTPIMNADAVGIASGSYYVFLCFSFAFLTLFLQEYLKDAVKLAGACKNALVLAGVLFAALYLILVGMFGADALATMDFPAVTLMSRVQITGGFLKRTDAFMFGIWFFTLYSLLNSAVFYGGKLSADFWGAEREKGKKYFFAGASAVVFVIACCFYHSGTLRDWYEKFMWYVGTPYVVLIPVLLFCKHKFFDPEQTHLREQKKAEREWKRILKKAGKTAMFLAIALLFSGCKTAEIEDKSFPVFLAVKDTEDFCEGWFDKKQEGNLAEDYNHLKVIVIDRAFLEDDARMKELLTVLEQEKDVPQNTYVMAAENVDEILKTEEGLGEPLGNYLEEMVENAEQVKKDAYPTLGMLYQEKENQLETLFIPYLNADEGKPAIAGYEAWKRGSAVGLVDTDVAMLSFFLGNQLKEYTLKLEEHHFVTLSSAKNEFSCSEIIAENGLIEKHVQVTAVCEGKLLYQKEAHNSKESRQMLEEEILSYFSKIAEKALKQSIDVTNGYKKIGGYQRDWYAKYADTPELWEKEIAIDFALRINWTNLD